jgi:predicted nucleic acid-binding protein
MGRADGPSLGEASAELRKSTKSVRIKDSLIAATALVHGTVVVARNTRDFKKAGVKVLDPCR